MTRKLPADVADRLLDRLCDDDDFRARFRADPRAALGEIAPEAAADPDGVWQCLPGAQLPAAEDLRRRRELLRSQLSDGADFVIFNVGGR